MGVNVDLVIHGILKLMETCTVGHVSVLELNLNLVNFVGLQVVLRDANPMFAKDNA